MGNCKFHIPLPPLNSNALAQIPCVLYLCSATKSRMHASTTPTTQDIPIVPRFNSLHLLNSHSNHPSNLSPSSESRPSAHSPTQTRIYTSSLTIENSVGKPNLQAIYDRITATTEITGCFKKLKKYRDAILLIAILIRDIFLG
jgi:hypothetical protein